MNNGKFLNIENGIPKQEAAIATSGGSADASKMIKLDGSGRIDMSMMPVGVADEVTSFVASEALAAGDMVNIWNDAGVAKARKADAIAAGKEAHGFVLAGVAALATANVYFEGTVTGLTGLTPGTRQFLATTAGARTGTAPSGAGNVAQQVGIALSATEMSFEAGDPIVLA